MTISVIAEAETNSPPAANTTCRDRAPEGDTIPVLANDADPDGDDIGLDVRGSAERGHGDDRRRPGYTPPNGFASPLRYTIEDEEGARRHCDIVIEVSDRAMIAPLARPDLLVLVVGTSQVIDPRANDSDPDGSTSEPAHQRARAIVGSSKRRGPGGVASPLRRPRAPTRCSTRTRIPTGSPAPARSRSWRSRRPIRARSPSTTASSPTTTRPSRSTCSTTTLIRMAATSGSSRWVRRRIARQQRR